MVLFSSWIPGILENHLFFTFFLSFFPVFRCKSWFFTRWSCFLPGFPEFRKITFFFTFFCLFFLFSDVKVDFSHGGPVFFLDSRNFGKSPSFYLFLCLFFLFSDVKVDFSHGGPVFFLDSRNFGKSPFFTFFLSFFPVFRCKSWFFTRWSCFLPGFLESVFFFSFFCVFFCFYYVYFLFFLNWYFQTFHMKDSFNPRAKKPKKKLLGSQQFVSPNFQFCFIFSGYTNLENEHNEYPLKKGTKFQ